MDKSCYYILAYTILLLNFQIPCLAITTTNLTTDQSTLLVLKSQITLDPYHILTTNWTNSTSVCRWIGVTCGTRHHRVTALNISDMELSGSIPPQLGNLSFLVSLDLSYNSFVGRLPQELSQLHRLKHFTLRVNNFSGQIPSWFGLLHKLEYLSLRNNSFTGLIPNSLSNLSSLQVLDFSFNSLEGNIPGDFGRFQSLIVLGLQYNHLWGTIPLAIFNVSTLESIGFTSNELHGSLPTDMCRNLSSLGGIYLSYNKLSGQIPPGLSECSQLQLLSLSYNSFSGEIPAEIGKLKYLQTLFIGFNNLTGVIPQEIGNLQNLAVFSVQSNKITGEVPLNIFNISMLRYLLLSDNQFTGVTNRLNMEGLGIFGGVLPREIGKLYQLEELALGFNNLTGLIPPELFNISTIRFLSLTSNGLSGNFPTNFGYGLPVIEELLLNMNNLNGSIPESISNCTKLRILSLSFNKFTGFVPKFLGNLRLLERLQLFDNNLRTEPSLSSELSFITSLTNCRSLNHLAINDNPLDGIFPASIGNFSDSFQNFYAFNCKIKGSIPASIGNLSSLVTLALTDNELSGYIPATVTHLHNIQGLFLENNNMRGPIPDGLCDLHSLVEISLSQNRFSGPIPECLGNVTSLRHLFLDSNMLSSNIPSSLWNLKDVLEIDLSTNTLSGFLPSEIGNLVSAIRVNLSMNQLSGPIPSVIGNLRNLVNLSLARNRLEGSIPVSIGSMISLVSLDLSYNNLSGSIPMSSQELQHLEYFNVSFNSLRGEIPTGGPFRNFTVESFKANEALCGVSRFHVPRCRTVSKHKSWRRVHLALFILSGVVAFILLVSLAFIFLIYRRKDNSASRIDGVVSTIPERISYYELLQATEHFNESNLLGKGSFGSVYRGVLRDGKILAVKVFNSLSEAAFKSFDVECEVLRNIRHRNLTKVISSCSNKDFKALVLEYMPKGSLEKWLYSHNYCLSLVQRLNIMIDVASALEYLHHGYSTPIVHCDLKPSNVLLDEEMIGHVSDFGIAKLLGEGVSMVHTNTLATLGYIAPEYGLEGLVSTRCDVYSYGVMLMEIFTRKKPSDDMFGGDLSLKSWVESLLLKSSSQVIDANLLNQENEHIEKNLECVSSILELALKCSAESPGDRINMKQVVAELLKIKAQFSCIMH
ncbi:hypothetical protein DH2020_009032 [Rehmannia glutinosa]|uniref:Protein kinase domain-containing protein n=1 Tax=Rehmannia glutinosa TaxID=99300 RepID=A0ABR0X8B6_REHGL